jgi:hypothetical protein
MAMNGTKQVAQRMVNAYENLVANLVDLGHITFAEAQHAADYYVKHKIVKMDAVGGRYILKHGIFADADVIQRAAKS